MKRALASLWVCSFAFCQTVAIQDLNDPKRGRLAGMVEDEAGRPLAGAKVTATPPGPIAARLPNTVTDAEGHFALAGLLPGKTYVQASKEEDFYPDALFGLWDPQGTAVVEVPLGGEVAGIVLQVRPCASLEIKAADAITGDTIQHLTVRLERDGEPNRWVSGSAKNNVWLVPTAPIRVMVSARGYQSAWYGEDGPTGQAEPIVLAPRQQFIITVLLHPAANN